MSWTCYLTGRLLMGVLDFATDCLQSSSLLSSGHTSWGLLTLLFPLLAAVAAATSVLVGRCRRGDPIKTCKFLLLSLKCLTSLFEGLLESGPELVLQTVVAFHGVHLEDLLVLLSGDEAHYWSWPWIRGLLHILSVVASLVSLLFTLTHLNEERLKRSGDCAKFVLSLCSTFASVLFRVFAAAVLFSVAPAISVGIALAIFLINLVVLFVSLGMDFETSVLFGYANLFSPSGYARNVSEVDVGSLKRRRRSSLGKTSASTAARESFSEVERAKINQESLLRSAAVSHGAFFVTSLLILVPYVTLLEVYLFPAEALEDGIIAQMSNRLVLYITPLLLLLFSSLFSALFVLRVRKSRDAARHWFAITPHRNRRTSNSITRGKTTAAEVHLNDERQNSLVSNCQSEASTVVCGDTLPLRPTAPTNLPEAAAGDTSQPPFNPDYAPGSGCSPVKLPLPAGAGTGRCGKTSCVTCELFIEGPNFKSMMTGKEYRFMPSVSCDTKSVIYLVTCARCKKQYVGKTEQSVKQRHYGHRREIEQQLSPLGKHFANSCGYASWRMQIIDHSETGAELKRKEGYWQHELMTLLPWGLNTRDELNGGTDITVS